MIGRRAVIGLALLSALLFSALAVQSASAAKAVNTTGFTCIAIANGGFNDPHCDVAEPGGGFGHASFSVGTPTEVTATNNAVTESTKKSEPAVLKSKVGLVETEITCNVVENEPKNSVIKNEEPAAGQHTVSGTVRTLFKTCTVNKPAKCTVKEPITSNAKFTAVEKLGAGSNEMGGELVGSGAEETFAEITFEGGECALKGKTVKVKGSVIGTSGPTTTSSQTNKHSGATVVFTPEKEMQKLKLGVETATFSTIVTQTGPSGNPLSGTTNT
jgi:hypothetical protein